MVAPLDSGIPRNYAAAKEKVSRSTWNGIRSPFDRNKCTKQTSPVQFFTQYSIILLYSCRFLEPATPESGELMRLAINVDHVATLRQARGAVEPDPVTAAHLCELAGAEGIVCHLREDRRHIQDRDLRLLRETVKTKLDLEMAATDEIIKIALETVPELVTLVPERRQELTTEGGLDVLENKHHLRDVIMAFHQRAIPVSLFVDPRQDQIEAAKEVEADFIEIHTGEYANARGEREVNEQLVKVQQAARLGKLLGLGVNGGHGLNYFNICPIVDIKEIDEVSIGHSVISRAMFLGIDQAVREMLRLVKRY